MTNIPERDASTPALRYVDYEVAGFHSPYIDMVKSIYLDNFFTALYADLLVDDITDACISGTSWKVHWEVNESNVDIAYNFKVNFLATGCANFFLSIQLT